MCKVGHYGSEILVWKKGREDVDINEILMVIRRKNREVRKRIQIRRKEE